MKIKKSRDYEADCEVVRNTPAYKLERSMIDFTERISARIDEIGITQSALAERMGVSRSQITNLLRGAYKNFTFETAHRIAFALDMDFEPVLSLRGGMAGKRAQSSRCQSGSVEGK